jgi:hypothetical protein
MKERRGAQRALAGNARKTDHLDVLSIDGRITLKRIFKKWDGGMDWIDLAQDRDRWQAVVNVVMNILGT